MSLSYLRNNSSISLPLSISFLEQRLGLLHELVISLIVFRESVEVSLRLDTDDLKIVTHNFSSRNQQRGSFQSSSRHTSVFSSVRDARVSVRIEVSICSRFGNK